MSTAKGEVSSRRSVLAMALLSMLTEEPMHAYRMQQLIKERHKDEVVNVAARNSVYQTLERLLRDGLIGVESTGRDDNRPERTVYEITKAGRAALRAWLHAMLSTPAREFPEFPAALAFLATFPPASIRASLTARVAALEGLLAGLEAGLAEARTFLPRVFLVESEYQRAVLTAELAYVKSLVDDLASGALCWGGPPKKAR